jgi:putative DNA primase/helicase
MKKSLSPEYQAAVSLGAVSLQDELRQQNGETVKALPTAPTVVSVSSNEFIQMDLPERKNLLSPWLPEQGLAMVHAERGIGKTFFGLGCAYAIATGGAFLSFKAPKPRPVLYIDGEMPAAAMQERLMQLQVSNPCDEILLRIITPDLQPKDQRSINLSDPSFQESLTADVEWADLIVVDNISTLVRGGKENEAESWLPVQDWALRQRAAGRSVLWVHHSGKGGAQRGTSRREDVLDTSIALKRPPDYSPDQGAVFEVHFQKSRGFTGDDAQPLEASLTVDERGRQIWSYRSLEASTYDRCCDLANEGLKNHEIAVELGLNKSSVSRHLKKARQDGDISV